MSDASSTSNDRNPVEALADDFLHRQRCGERPALEDYCRRHPELADEIREVFPVLIRMEDLRSDGPGGVPVHTATPLERLGDYRILREVGRGGMGVVYEAEQESLGRRVALKVLPDAALSDPQQILRFQREARAAARLHHTNIVPVFGVGRDDGYDYYVMQFIPGMGLDAVLEELRRLRRGAGSANPPGGRGRSYGVVSAAEVAEAILTGRFSLAGGADPVPQAGTTLAASVSAPLVRPATLAPRPAGSSVVSLPGASADSLARSDPDRTFFHSVARIGVQVAEALDYANRQGVLHRDVKPSNLLLDPKGNVWVADFGLAKAADAEDLTHSGDIVGTVRYMAPERFAGKCDARSDVYALGLTLYELLALRPAYSAADRHELMRRVMSEEPERLRALVPHLPRDLDTIVHKAIDRDPARRYPTAAALAEDLQRYLDDKPIKARRVTAAEQVWRWAKRNPAVAALAIGLMLALVAGLAGVTWQWRKAVANLGMAEAANRKAQARFDLAMEAVKAFTAGASEDVLLREKQLAGLRQRLLEGSLSFYDRLAGSLEGETDHASRRSLAQAVYDAAELNGRIGRQEEAHAAHLRAIGLRQGLAHEAPGDVTVRRELGRSELALGETLHALGRHDEAREALAQSRAILEGLLRERPADSDTRVILADGFLADGRWLFELGRPGDARPLLDRALDDYDHLINEGSSATGSANGFEKYLRDRATCSLSIGRCYSDMGDGPEALGWFERAIAEYEELTRRLPGDVDLWLALADSHSAMCEFLWLNVDRSQSRQRHSFRRAEAIYERLARDNPTVTKIRLGWAQLLLDAERSFFGDLNEQLKYRKLSVQLLRELVVSDPDVPPVVARLGLSLTFYGFALWEAGQRSEGMHLLKESVELLETQDFSEFSHGDRTGAAARLISARNLAIALAFSGQAAEGLGVVGQSLALGERVIARQNSRSVREIFAQNLALHSYLASGVGRPAEAAGSVERAAAILEPMDLPPPTIWILGGIHALWYLQGRSAAPGRVAEPPGRPEHATQSIALLRRAADRGYVDPNMTAAFFGPILGDLPEFRTLMEDLKFPVDPFQSEPGSDDDGPLSDAGTQAMTSSSTSNDRNPVEALADEFLRRQRSGERPTLEDYGRRHPDLADETREVPS
jgi:tetratricopeptide (TPR) repeat protein